MKKVLIISGDGFEDSELLVPYYRLREIGVKVDIASPKKGKIRGKHGYEVKVDKGTTRLSERDYNMLILPGGRAPAAIRTDKGVQKAARDFMEAGKPVAAICHGPQVLISAGVMEGRKATSYRKVRQELQDAGANYLDKEVVVDRNLITSRHPADLPAFSREIIKKLG